MKIEQMYTGCLAEAAYYIESEGEVAIIDPLRETEPYVEKAKENGAKIKYIFETHFHADFVSGHIDLAKKTGATIVYGPNANPEYDIYSAKDGEEFELGKVKIKILHTPGHTMESTTYLLIDEEGKNHSIFTGDTLFIGDVGRPDLAVKSDLTKEDLAGFLYDSLRNKIMPLEDEVIVYPGHGAGSACGKNMSKETTDTLGHQKEVNYALRDMSKEEFIKEVTDGIMPPPQYFPKNAMINKLGYDSIDEVMEKGLRAMSPDDIEEEMRQGAILLDTRKPQEFNQAFIPGSLYIGLDGSFAVWVGTLIKDLQQKIIVLADEGRESEAVLRLARVGYDNSIGYVDGGIDTWIKAGKPVDSITSISAEELQNAINAGKVEELLDVRKPSEYDAEHVETATNFPLDFINDHLNDLAKDKTYHIHCAGGYRSMIAASILRQQGYKNLIDIKGGFNAIAETGIPKTAFVCQAG